MKAHGIQVALMQLDDPFSHGPAVIAEQPYYGVDQPRNCEWVGQEGKFMGEPKYNLYLSISGVLLSVANQSNQCSSPYFSAVL